MKDRWGYVGCMILCILMLVGCGENKTAEKAVPLVKTITIGSEKVAAEETFSGTVHGKTESPLAFQIGGKIVARYVKAGDEVHMGDPLYQLDSRDVTEQVAAARGQVDAAAAQLDLANKNVRRFEELYAQNAISAMQIDQVRSSQQLAQAQWNQAQAALHRAMNQESFATLRADQDGVVGTTMMEVGQVTAPGTPVVMLVDRKEMEVLISLVERSVGSVAVGQPVEVLFWAHPEWRVAGTIREIAATPNPHTGTYDARVALQSVPKGLQVGMTAQVKCIHPETAQVLVPLTAMAPQSAEPAVWVVRDGRVHLVKVVPGAYRGDQVEIRSGLSAGDVVVTAGTQHLTENEQVRL